MLIQKPVRATHLKALFPKNSMGQNIKIKIIFIFCPLEFFENMELRGVLVFIPKSKKFVSSPYCTIGEPQTHDFSWNSKKGKTDPP